MENIPILFVTSSKKKFAHIEYLAKLHGIDVFHDDKIYDELQENDIHLQLKHGHKVLPDTLKEVFFIIEQTSVYLHAFEGKGKGPGYYFKDWWESKSDDVLKLVISRNPIATIESGLALNIPGLETPLIFTNQQKGNVTFEGKILDDNREYDWLNSKDFNYYFVPKGATKVYTHMSLNEFLKHDFRRPNVDKMCERILEYSAILNSNVTLDSIIKKGKEFAPIMERKQPVQKRVDELF